MLYPLQIHTPSSPILPFIFPSFPFSPLIRFKYNRSSPASFHQSTVRWCSWLSRQSNIPVRITEGLQFKSGSNHHSDLKDLFFWLCPPDIQGKFSFFFSSLRRWLELPAVDTLPHQGDWEPGSSRCGRFFFPVRTYVPPCGSFVHTAAAWSQCCAAGLSREDWIRGL
jgi:hypothetical protein